MTSSKVLYYIKGYWVRIPRERQIFLTTFPCTMRFYSNPRFDFSVNRRWRTQEGQQSDDQTPISYFVPFTFVLNSVYIQLILWAVLIGDISMDVIIDITIVVFRGRLYLTMYT